MTRPMTRTMESSGTTPRCLVVGEALVDVVEGVPHPGGSPMNVAIGLARLGLPTTLLTRIGDDAEGRLLAAHIADAGVEIADGSVQAGAHTSRAVAMIGVDGAASYDFDLDWRLPDTPAATAELVHVGSLGAVVEPGADAVRSLFCGADSATIRSFDPNVRPALLPHRSVAIARIEELMSAADVVKLSDEDAAWLYPELDSGEVLTRVGALGPDVVALTRGGEGCVVAVAGLDEPLVRSAAPVSVVDTIGAGDAFMSGLLFGMLGSSAALHAPDAIARWGVVVDTAVASAGIAVSRAGAVPPRPDELGRMLARVSPADPSSA